MNALWLPASYSRKSVDPTEDVFLYQEIFSISEYFCLQERILFPFTEYKNYKVGVIYQILLLEF